MPQVTLYKVDNKLRLVFDTGDHVLGRGAKLMCDSKKVSRNHGVLKIDNAGVFLHSTHNNPCFRQKSQNSHISIITFGNSVQICNGDKISLSLDHGWFKVQIQPEHVQNITENVAEVPETSITVDENRKRSNTNSEMTINKKIKIEIPDIEIKLEPPEINEQGTLNQFETTENALNISSENIEETVELSRIENLQNAVESLETMQLDLQQAETSSGGSGNLQNVVEPPETSSGGSGNLLNVVEPPKTIQQAEDGPEASESLLNQDVPQTEEDAIAQEVLTPEVVQQAETTANTSSAVEIKTEPIDESNEIESNNVNVDKVLIKTEIEEDKDATDKTGSKVKEEDKPSTSGTNNRVWRDRCWYGKACYRKNAGHRAEFRHFDDSDYDSDSNDSRPICCYGAGCYRKNAEHRRKYRHPGQDRLPQKPTQPQQPKTRPKRRKAKTKKQQATPDYEDLVSDEESDPYLSGGSSDDYTQTDHSDTESDSDQEDNTQDIEKEAKKLVKHMRKKQK